MRKTIEITDSVEKLLTASKGPAAKAATAPKKLATASTPPWEEARVSLEITALNRADPATLIKDQPTPRRIRETISQPVTVGQIAPMASDTRKTAIPMKIAHRCPRRSAINPTIGSSAYIPTMCKLIVRPTSLTESPR